MTLTRPQPRPPSRSVSIVSGLDRAAEDYRNDLQVNIVPSFQKTRLRPSARTHRRRAPPRSRGQFLFLSLVVALILVTTYVSLRRYPRLLQKISFFSWKSFEEKPRPRLFALITDLDRQSCRDAKTGYQTSSCSNANVWVSYFKRAILPTIPGSKAAKITWVDKIRLESRTQVGSRGMELSELQWFSGHLLAPDDRTGILYEIVSPKGELPGIAKKFLYGAASSIRPSIWQRALLPDGAGKDQNVLFKSEWTAVKDGMLVIGGHGRAMTDPRNGTIVRSSNPLWVKIVTPAFRVTHENWAENYVALERAAGVSFPGYLMHEAVLWSVLRREWVFLPRRRSDKPFDSVANEKKGWNYALIASERFDSVRSVEIPELYDANGFLGFSSAKFVPGTNEEIVVALRTMEIDAGNHGHASRYTESFLCAFSIVTGQVLLKEQRVGYKKYEGLAFL